MFMKATSLSALEPLWTPIKVLDGINCVFLVLFFIIQHIPTLEIWFRRVKYICKNGKKENNFAYLVSDNNETSNITVPVL